MDVEYGKLKALIPIIKRFVTEGVMVGDVKDVSNGLLSYDAFSPQTPFIGMTMVYVNNRISVPVRDSVVIKDGDVVSIELRVKTKTGHLLSYAEPFIIGDEGYYRKLLTASGLAYRYIVKYLRKGVYPTEISKGLHAIMSRLGCTMNENLSVGAMNNNNDNFIYFRQPSRSPLGRFASRPVHSGIYYINPVIFHGSSRLYVDNYGVYSKGVAVLRGRMVCIDTENVELGM